MIIQSILDTDLYKFSMSYFYFRLYPYAEGVYGFVDRGKEEYTPEFLDALRIELCCLENLSLRPEELEWCKSRIPYIPASYWEWLSSFRFDSSKVRVSLDEDNHLHLEVSDVLYKSTLYEVPLMAIISQLRNRMRGYTADRELYLGRLREKIELSNREQLRFSEFGTRRRFSLSVQDDIVDELRKGALYCTGTSNVMLAMKYDMTPIGTCAHELCSFIASQYGYKHPNYILMEKWSSVYRGDLGIYLTDTFTTDTFLRDFTKAQAKLWDGVRHDSGDPYLYISKICRKYQELGIDPKTKTIIFSNALTMPEYKLISDACKGRIKCAAGIGTNLTNDTGNPPSNIVIKLVKSRLNSEMDWEDCIKISDDHGKVVGKKSEIELAFSTLKISR